MSLVDVRDLVLDSPDRAFSLFTVRAAISSARLSLAPWSFWLSLMCSYWRARLVPFFTPRGGTLTSRFVKRRLGHPALVRVNPHAWPKEARRRVPCSGWPIVP